VRRFKRIIRRVDSRFGSRSVWNAAVCVCPAAAGKEEEQPGREGDQEGRHEATGRIVGFFVSDATGLSRNWRYSSGWFQATAAWIEHAAARQLSDVRESFFGKRWNDAAAWIEFIERYGFDARIWIGCAEDGTRNSTTRVEFRISIGAIRKASRLPNQQQSVRWRTTAGF
jgi:hypothetical protein